MSTVKVQKKKTIVDCRITLIDMLIQRGQKYVGTYDIVEVIGADGISVILKGNNLKNKTKMKKIRSSM